MLGPPGAGKGTQAAALAERRGVPHVATGDLLRAAVAAETDVGLKAKSYMDAGRYVPDEVMLGVIAGRLAEGDAAEGFVLDGFPRTVVQAEAFDKMLADAGTPLERVLLFDVADDEIVTRIAGRRTCSACGHVYNMATAPPRVEGRCDLDGAGLMRRSDESEDLVRTRLGVYREQTVPVVEFYEQRGLLRRVDGFGSPDEVAGRIEEALA